jgi:hypothetical protein
MTRIIILRAIEMFTCGEPSVYGLKHITKIQLLTLYILDVCLHDRISSLRGKDWAC